MGKTQIALEYATLTASAQGIKAILWVASEDESEAAKSFTEIAEALAFTDEEGGLLLRQELGFVDGRSKNVELSTKGRWVAMR